MFDRFSFPKRKRARFYYNSVFACLHLSELTDIHETWHEHFVNRKHPKVFIFAFNKKKKQKQYGGSAKY